MSKKKKDSGGIVYSTDPSFFLRDAEEETNETLPPAQQDLRVWLDRKHRGGKTVTIIKGFVGAEKDLEEIARKLKVFCGSGGAVKDGEIIIQGEHRQKILEWLHKEGYRAKAAGG